MGSWAMVFQTAPPQPASKARRTWYSELVGGADASQNGLGAGTPQKVTLSFPTTAVTWPAGWELRVYLSSSNWPRYERNTHTGTDHWDAKAAVPLSVTVHHPAELTLPAVVEGK